MPGTELEGEPWCTNSTSGPSFFSWPISLALLSWQFHVFAQQSTSVFVLYPPVVPDGRRADLCLSFLSCALNLLGYRPKNQ